MGERCDDHGELVREVRNQSAEVSQMKTDIAVVSANIANISSQTKTIVLEALKEEREFMKDELVAVVKAALPAPTVQQEQKSSFQSAVNPVLLAIIGLISTIVVGFYKLAEMYVSHPAAVQAVDKITKGN